MVAVGNKRIVLGLSDEVVPLVDSPNIRGTFQDVDIIVSCGDLPSEYLEYALTTLNKRLFYVPGNHDPDQFEVPGGDKLDGRLVRIQDMLFLGFGGSVRYKNAGKNQYTQTEMAIRFLPFLPRLYLRRLLTGSGLDLLAAHAPPFGIHDDEDLAHQGFKIFRRMIQVVKPGHFIHGHTHIHANISTTETFFAGCRILNIFPYKVFSIPIRISNMSRNADMDISSG